MINDAFTAVFTTFNAVLESDFVKCATVCKR